MSEIADNKWELSASKPPIMTIPSIAQILMMGGFAIIFAYVIIFSLVGAFGPKKDGGLEEQFTNMKAGGNPAPAGE